MKERLQEPSTYAALAAAIAPAAAIPVATPYVMGASALLGLIGVFMKEGAKDKK